MFVCFKNIFLAVVTAPVGGEKGLDSWLKEKGLDLNESEIQAAVGYGG